MEENIIYSKTLNRVEDPPRFLQLSTEVRLLIFSHLVKTERPFLIGRVQEERRKNNGSPRDACSMRPRKKFKILRDESKNRPKQPGITRVCRAFRAEALPLFYKTNQFWLIHNEFMDEPNIMDPNQYFRRFNAWISQAPKEMFNIMEHVSLCGYGSGPNRMMLSIDLKNRQVLSYRHYSTYGDDMPDYHPEYLEMTKQLVTRGEHESGLALLRAVLKRYDGIFCISTLQPSAPPRLQRGREPATGWEYDW